MSAFPPCGKADCNSSDSRRNGLGLDFRATLPLLREPCRASLIQCDGRIRTIFNENEELGRHNDLPVRPLLREVEHIRYEMRC